MRKSQHRCSFVQEDADLRLLRTPFSICWSSLTEIALSYEHKTNPLSGFSLTTNVAEVKKGFKQILDAAADWPHLTSQLVKEPPKAFLLIGFLLRKAGWRRLRANTAHQHQQDRRPLRSWMNDLPQGGPHPRCCPSLCGTEPHMSEEDTQVLF